MEDNRYSQEDYNDIASPGGLVLIPLVLIPRVLGAYP